MSNEINLFSRQSFKIKPIQTQQLSNPAIKAMQEYQQFKRNYYAQPPKKQRMKQSQSAVKQSKLKLISQSMDSRNLNNQSSLSFASDNIYSKKSLLFESPSTLIYKVQVDGHFHLYALKIVKLNPKSKEVYFLRQLRHPNIITLKHFYVINDKGEQLLHTVMPLMSCNLRQFFQQYIKYHALEPVSNNPKKQKAPIILYKLYLYQLVRGVAYLHQKQITHRNICPSNVLIDLETLSLQICDFHQARILQSGIPQSSDIGERNYRAPELLLGSKTYTQSIDIWSIGCIVAECFIGEQLFKGTNIVETMADVIKLMGTPKTEELKAMKSPLLDLKMPEIKKFPLKRRFTDKIDHLIELLELIFIYEPHKRISAFDMLLHPFFDEIKQPNIKINSRSLPNIFNFTKDELGVSEYKNKQLVPQWYLEKQKRFEYLKTSMEDALLILER